jgi:hypothetical protein
VVVPKGALTRLLAAAAASLAVAVLVPGVAAAAPPLGQPFSLGGNPHLTKDRAIAIFVAYPKVAHWLSRYPASGRITDATYDSNSARCTFGTQGGCWTVMVWWKQGNRDAGEIATGRVDDRRAVVTEAWTGPQVAWLMARGTPGAFGGTKINSYSVWLGLCAAFLVGLANFRKPLSIRNLDLLMLLSFSVSLWFFNRGNIFASVPLAYPPLVYLTVRTVWIGFRGRATTERPLWPAWLLLAGTVFLIGFRIGLNVENKGVIDVGYAGVIGAERIAHGQVPYGNFPQEGTLKPCGPANEDGEIRNRIQTDGRCESANPNGDTYGPVAYEAYLPAYGLFGWSGKWDSLPAAHAAAIAFDLLCLVGLGLVGVRFGGPLLGATLAFSWAAYPFTQYVSNSNSNDALLPALLIWGFLFVSSPWARGIFVALSAWTKFAALAVVPLWLTYPEFKWRVRPTLAYVGGFALATAAAFSILLLDPSPIHAAHVFYDRTLKSQIDRQSPFSLWDWRQYHARGLPDLHVLQKLLEGLVVVAAIAFAFVPQRKSPLQLAALTAALLLGFELVLTHWFYLYIPWFFPFAAFAFLAPGDRRDAEPEPVAA